MQQGSGATYDQYENTTPDLHPKRMYMSVDGLVCSKAYFDQEAIEYTPEGGDAPVYPVPLLRTHHKKSVGQLVHCFLIHFIPPLDLY